MKFANIDKTVRPPLEPLGGPMRFILFPLAFFAPLAAKAAPVQYADCARYDSLSQASQLSSPKEKANIYLNGALDRLEAGMNGPLPAEEVQRRDACVQLALERGADPNNRKAYSPPLLLAINADDLVAVNLLLKHKADPNVKDSVLGNGEGVPALIRAASESQEDIGIALVAAGADPNERRPLWMAAAVAKDRLVEALLKTGKIPVNQLTQFSSIGDDEETALDASEARIAALRDFAKSEQNSSPEKKLQAANSLLFSYYPFIPRLQAKANIDQAMANLLAKQSHVSELLRAGGWSCHKPNCGLPAQENDEPGDPDKENTEASAQ